jgi:transcriptional regulator with XRE-family HTH domain
MNTFAERLKALRVRRGFSLSGLARAMGVSNTGAGHWEAGDTKPRPENLAKLASVLGTTPEYLERGEETPAATADKAESVQRTLPDPAVVQRHRQAIAAEAGLDPAQVKIVLDFGSFSVAV